ncbi:MAG: hypothetical protein LBO68_04340, partial [Synergistaceae bacterium]|nr:hypothetical protein [Synergistaceae bacterium]
MKFINVQAQGGRARSPKSGLTGPPETPLNENRRGPSTLRARLLLLFGCSVLTVWAVASGVAYY